MVNSQLDTSTFSGLREYYHVNSLILWRTHCEFEEHLEEKAREILERYEEESSEGSSNAAFELHEIDIQQALMLRYAMLPRFLGLLERMIKGICKAIDIQAYQAVDQRDWLRNHLDFLRSKGVDLVKTENSLNSLRNLIVLRDCIIHANGEIAACKHPEQVEAAIRNVATAGTLSDGFLWLGDQVLAEAQTAMSEILVHLFQHVGYPLDWTRWH